jgi:hypothetical protein
MTLVYLTDLIPILISLFMFSLLAMGHRVLLPAKYSAFLQFKEEEDVNKTVQSTSIRIIYLIVGTSFLNLILGFNEKQIGIGVFVACFLNIWPAIIQNQLLKLNKNKTEWLVLMGYVVFSTVIKSKECIWSFRRIVRTYKIHISARYALGITVWCG